MAGPTEILDRKVVLPRVSRAGRLGLNWEPRPWRELKAWVHDTGTVNWTAFQRTARNAVLQVQPGSRPLSREDHLKLKSMYVILQQGYVLRDAEDRVAAFVRPATETRITTGASVVVSVPWRLDPAHADGAAKLARLVSLPASVPFEFKPLGLAYRELTLENGRFGPAYFWLLHEARCAEALPRAMAPRPGRDAFVGMKDARKLLSGQVTCARQSLALSAALDEAVLGSLCGEVARERGAACLFRRLRAGELDGVPAFTKEPEVELTNGRLANLGLLGLGAYTLWQAADTLGTVEWVYDKLQVSLAQLQTLLLSG